MKRAYCKRMKAEPHSKARPSNDCGSSHFIPDLYPPKCPTTSQTSHTGGLLDAGVWINLIRTVRIGAIPGGEACPSRVREGVTVASGVFYRLASKHPSWERKMYPNACSEDGSKGQTPQAGLLPFTRASSPMPNAQIHQRS
jgi:hypothetical protein